MGGRMDGLMDALWMTGQKRVIFLGLFFES